MTEVITFGRHKGERWSAVPEDYLRWLMKSFSPGPSRNRAVRELEKRLGKSYCPKCGATLIKRPRKKQTFKSGQAYYFAWHWWCKSCRFIRNDESAKRFRDVKTQAVTAGFQKHSEADWESTHYRWADRNGHQHWILNDVDMSGRENEACPF